jgi:hypothetical protein
MLQLCSHGLDAGDARNMCVHTESTKIDHLVCWLKHTYSHILQLFLQTSLADAFEWSAACDVAIICSAPMVQSFNLGPAGGTAAAGCSEL